MIYLLFLIAFGLFNIVDIIYSIVKEKKSVTTSESDKAKKIKSCL